MDNQLYIIYKNKIFLELKDLNSIISRNKKSIENLRVSDLNVNFIKEKINKLELDNANKSIKIEELNNTISSVDRGELDEIIKTEYKYVIDNINAKTLETKKKKTLSVRSSNEDIVKSKKYNNDERHHYKSVKYEHKMFDSSYKFYIKSLDKLPNYMANKLDDMSNNKGYIYRGIWFFGKNPCVNYNTLTMFEKKYNERDVLYIHEYSDTIYNLYSKIGNNRKTLVSSQIRKKKVLIV